MAGTFFGKRLDTASRLSPTVGVPGAQDGQEMEPELAAMLLNRDGAQRTISQEDI